MAGILNSIDISATGMTLQRQKMDTVAQNIANAETTRTDSGGPYRRQRVVVSELDEKAPFKTALHQARSRLARTHRRHLPAAGMSRQDTVEIAKARGETVEDPTSAYRLVYDPGHPDANDEGMVKMPDVEIITEMVDMMASSRAYEANTTAVLTAKEMAKNALEI